MVPQADEPRRTGELLRQGEERYRILVEGIRDYAIFLLDPEGCVVSWNAGAERLKGYKPDEIIGQHFSRFYPAEAVARRWPDHELRRAVAEGRFEDEGWRVRKDGSRFWANVVITALKDEAGALIGFAKVTRDLTERKLAEEQARQLAREQAARAAAETVSRRKDQFLAVLSHELRGPLAPILNSLPVLRVSWHDGATVEKCLDVLERQTRHLTRLVEGLLDVTRIEGDAVVLHTERLDFVRLVRAAVEDRRPELERAGLLLSFVGPETPVWVMGDEARLAQVVANLLDNARKFTDWGGSVEVRVAVDERTDEVLVTVADTGTGIPAAFLPELFTPFTQADHSPDRPRGGLGLGLAVVKGLVGLHGGRVAVSSPGEGRGAEFTVGLPVETEPSALTAPPVELRHAVKRLRVVVVEDNRDSADSLRMLLEVLGYEARVAYTGPEGLRTAVSWHPDVVLSDVGLPGLNGLNLASELRKDPATAGALLVGISGYGSDEDRSRARRAGFDHYLVKPADPGDIQQILATRSG